MNRLVVAVAVGAALVGCRGGGPEREPAGALAYAVEVYEVARGEVRSEIRRPGRVEAALRAEIHTKTSGRLVDLRVDVGDEVEAGELLAVVDQSAALARLRRAEAALELAEASWDRISRLFEEGVASAQERDEARSALESATAERDEARSALEDTLLTAPFAGVVSRRYIDLGGFALPGSPVLELVQEEPLKVLVELTGEELARVNVGIPAYVSFAGASGEVEGRVARVSPVLEESRTGQVEVRLAGSGGGARPGMFCLVRFVTEVRPDVLVVPTSALVTASDSPAVYLAENGIARLRHVEVGLEFRGLTEVRAGLSEGDPVVVTNLDDLTDGARIRVVGKVDAEPLRR